MGRSGNPLNRAARQASAKQRLEAPSATPPQEILETPVPNITEAPSRAHATQQELPEDHWKNPCKVPAACDYKGTASDCFWFTPVMFASSQDEHASAA